MNGLNLIADTNVLVYLISENEPVRSVVHESNLSVSFITEMELLGWPSAKENELRIIAQLLYQCKIISLNDDIKKLAIDIRRNYRIKLPDSIVAVTAPFLNMPLMSADHGFKKIEKFELLLIDVSI